MRVLVTGGAGFIGSHTVDRLVERGIAVRVLDSLERPVHQSDRPPEWLHPKAEFVRGDVTRREQLLPALAGVDAVFHLAAYQDYLPDFSKFFRVNAVGTALLYELVLAERLPVRKIVVASSQAVYGEGRYRCADGRIVYPPMRGEDQLRRGEFELRCPDCGGPAQWLPTDESVVNPQNQYALSKHAQEQIAIQLGRRYEIPSVALRYSIVQGPRQSFTNAYSGACRVFCLALRAGRVPPIYEDGLQVRDFVNIHDVVDANLLVLDDPRADYQVLNVGGGRPCGVLELAALAARAFGRELDLRPAGTYRFGDTRHIVSDVGRLRALGWEPRRSVEESVAEYRDWLQGFASLPDSIERAEAQMRELGVVREVGAQRAAS